MLSFKGTALSQILKSFFLFPFLFLVETEKISDIENFSLKIKSEIVKTPSKQDIDVKSAQNYKSSN